MNTDDLIRAYAKQTEQLAQAKADLKNQRGQLEPWNEVVKRAQRDLDDTKNQLRDLLTPGQKLTAESGTVSLSRPTQKFVKEVDMQAVIAWMEENHPDVLKALTTVRDVTPAPRLTVKEAN